MIDNSKSSERRNDTRVILYFLKTTSGKPETSLTHSNSQIKHPATTFKNVLELFSSSWCVLIMRRYRLFIAISGGRMDSNEAIKDLWTKLPSNT